jgi:GT2 family glycosyltransferase
VDFGMMATWVKIIDENGKATGTVLKDTTSPEKIPATLLFHNIFACSSVMLRRSALPEIPFRQETMPVEDVDLWFRMISAGSKFYIIREILTEYRAHGKGISKIHSEKRREMMNNLTRQELGKLGIIPSDHELMIHRTNFSYTGDNLENFLNEREAWLIKLKKHNDKNTLYPIRIFNEVITEKFLDSLRSNCRPLGLRAWKIFWKSGLSKNLNWRDNWQKIFKFFLKCLLKR